MKHDTFIKDDTGKIIKEWRSGQKGKYGADSEIYMNKKGEKTYKKIY